MTGERTTQTRHSPLNRIRPLTASNGIANHLETTGPGTRTVPASRRIPANPGQKRDASKLKLSQNWNAGDPQEGHCQSDRPLGEVLPQTNEANRQERQASGDEQVAAVPGDARGDLIKRLQSQTDQHIRKQEVLIRRIHDVAPRGDRIHPGVVVGLVARRQRRKDAQCERPNQKRAQKQRTASDFRRRQQAARGALGFAAEQIGRRQRAAVVRRLRVVVW